MSQFANNDALFEALKVYDHTAQTELYERLLPGLARVSFKIVKDEEQAHDIAKDRFWKYMSLIDKMNDYTHLRNSLFLATKRLSINYVEKRKGYYEVNLETVNLEEVPDAETSNEIIEDEVLAFVRQKIALLPGNEKLIAQCAYVDGMTSKEIGELLKKSTRSVESSRSRIITKIRIALAKARLIKIFIFLTLLFPIDYANMETFFKKNEDFVSSKGSESVYNNKTIVTSKYH